MWTIKTHEANDIQLPSPINWFRTKNISFYLWPSMIIVVPYWSYQIGGSGADGRSGWQVDRQENPPVWGGYMYMYMKAGRQDAGRLLIWQV